MRVFINGNSHIRSKKGVGLKECRNVWLHTDRIRIDSCKQMIHGCVCAHRHSVNMAGWNTSAFAHLRNQRVDGLFNYGILQLFLSSWLLLLDDTVDNICAETDLSVSGGSLGKNFSCLHIDQNCGHGGSTNIDCQTTDYYILIFSENIIYKKIIWCSPDYTFHFEMVLPEHIR